MSDRTCACGHPRTGHKKCGNGLIVCMATTGPPGNHPPDGFCACRNYTDEAERTCECGCGRSLEGRRANTHYALTACRVRGHRKRYESVTEPKRRGGPSGLQVSYAKAVRMLTADYRELNLPNTEVRAAAMVRRMLSDAQRARLDERRGTEMSDIEHCLPADHPVSRDVPTLIYDSAAWVKAEHYDNAKIEIQRLVGAVSLTEEEASWLESAARRAAGDTIVPGAADQLRQLANKLARHRGQ